MHIVLVAAENGAFPGGKVGGLGDVIRDLPLALARAGHKVTVVTPGYGILANSGNSRLIGQVNIRFCNNSERIEFFAVNARQQAAEISHLVLEHPLFSASGVGRIYLNDGEGPFASDAHKFALLCAGTAEALTIGLIDKVDVIHCHDWHAAILLLLRQVEPRYEALKNILAVYSIHNLSLQGVRPFRGVFSSLENWFPNLAYQNEKIADPVHTDCINLMRTGINLADRVHTVSPSYAREILSTSNWDQGIVGGEGLEHDLRLVKSERRLFGIINGCEYNQIKHSPMQPAELWRLIEDTLADWAARGNTTSQSYFFALRNLLKIKRLRKSQRPVLLSIGRLTAQKLYLLIQDHGDGSVMDALLNRLRNGIFIMLGNGDPDYDRFFTKTMQQHDNFLFLSGYSEELSDSLYGFGDIYVMPSIYEPCGISQMLAMRAGVPCLVHQVGGLNDTVVDGCNGFSFGGDTLQEKLNNFFIVLDRALSLFDRHGGAWINIRDAAEDSRFLWDDSVALYLKELYNQPECRR